MPLIRPSTDEDVSHIAAIYRHHVLTGTGTFEIDPPSPADMAARRDDVLGKGLPFLVLESEGEVCGFAYCNWFKPRPAYRFSAEDSIYLAPEIAGRGWGRLLLAELVGRAERAGVRSLIAVIGDSGNTASIALHHGCGFTQVGVLAGCGWKFGRWLDVVLMQRAIGAGQNTPPAQSDA
jgi:phosphinothricin acetyltransferase